MSVPVKIIEDVSELQKCPWIKATSQEHQILNRNGYHCKLGLERISVVHAPGGSDILSPLRAEDIRPPLAT